MASSVQVREDPTHTTGGVTTDGTNEILAARSNRRFLYIQNVSDEDVWLRFDGNTAAAAAPAVKLATSGSESIQFSGVFVPTGSIKAIHGSTGTKNISIVDA
jgi:hypothetical protein